LFLSSTAGTSFATAIGTGSFTNAALDASLLATEGVLTSFYDSGAGQAVVGYLRNTSATVTNTLNSADTFVEVSRITMVGGDYTQANLTNSLLFF
jgi:hypothetical protein